MDKEINLTCLRCGNQWIKRKPGRPKACPNCKQPRWDTAAWAGAIADIPAKQGKKAVAK